MSEVINGNIQAEETIAGRVDKPEIVLGLSAYELALKHGFEGTEEEYLESLHGKDGHTPVKGVDYFTEIDKKEIADSVPKEVFVATYGETSYSDIAIAFQNNQQIVCLYESDPRTYTIPMIENIGSNSFLFKGFYEDNKIVELYIDFLGEWQKNDVELDSNIVIIEKNKATWDELVEINASGKKAIITDATSMYVQSLYVQDATPKYMKFSCYNGGSKSQDVLHIDEKDKVWKFVRDPLALKGDIKEECFVAEYNVTTFEEVQKAFNAGKRIECKYNIEGGVWARLPLVKNMGDQHFTFEGFTMWTSTRKIMNCVLSADGWKVEEENLASESTLETFAKNTNDSIKNINASVSDLKKLTKGFMGGGIGTSDIQANGSWNLAPNTQVRAMASKDGTLRLCKADGSNALARDYTIIDFYATIPAQDGSFNILGFAFSASSVFDVKFERIRFNATSGWKLLNTSSDSDIALYRDVRA